MAEGFAGHLREKRRPGGSVLRPLSTRITSKKVLDTEGCCPLISGLINRVRGDDG
jgi:hypothetical protein